MPLYDYQCKGCGGKFDEFRPINEREKCKCPTCGKMATRVATTARLDYYNMGVQDGLPTAISKWEKMHRKMARR